METVFNREHWLRVAEAWALYERVYADAAQKSWHCLFLAVSGMQPGWDE